MSLEEACLVDYLYSVEHLACAGASSLVPKDMFVTRNLDSDPVLVWSGRKWCSGLSFI